MLKIPQAHRQELERRAQDPSVRARVAKRARIVLLLADGYSAAEIAERVGCSEPTVVRWRRRYAEHGLAGLTDRPRAGRPQRIDEAKRPEILLSTLAPPPPESGVTHWSSRLLARRVGVHHSTVARLWQEYGLRPRPRARFRFSADPQLEAKVRDVVGLYLCPPEGAVVLSVGEPARAQAPDRTDPTALLARPSRDAATLLNALEDATASIVANAGNEPHRHVELITFLRQIAEAYPRVELRIVCNSYILQKRPEVDAWLTRHPSIVLHVAPTPLAGLRCSRCSSASSFFQPSIATAWPRHLMSFVVSSTSAINAVNPMCGLKIQERRQITTKLNLPAAHPSSYAVERSTGRDPLDVVMEFERYTSSWPDDDPDANFKREVAEYTRADPMPTVCQVAENTGIPVGALVRYVLVKWTAEGSEALMALGPRMVQRLWAVCEHAESEGTQASRLDAYAQLRDMLSWLRLPLADEGSPQPLDD